MIKCLKSQKDLDLTENEVKSLCTALNKKISSHNQRPFSVQIQPIRENEILDITIRREDPADIKVSEKTEELGRAKDLSELNQKFKQIEKLASITELKPSIEAIYTSKKEELESELAKEITKEVGSGISNPGINACYLNSTLQALRISLSFKKNIDYQWKVIQKDKEEELEPIAQHLIDIAEYPAELRNESWTTLIEVENDYITAIQDELSRQLGALDQNTQRYLTLRGQPSSVRDGAFEVLKAGVPIEEIIGVPDLKFLMTYLKAACEYDKSPEVLRKDLSETEFISLRGVLEQEEYSKLIDSLVQVQQEAKQKGVQSLKRNLGDEAPLVQFFQLSKEEQRECLRYPLTIQLKNLYDSIEGATGEPQVTVDKDTIQSIRQLARLGKLDARDATSQEDAFSFLGCILDILQAEVFPFSDSENDYNGNAFILSIEEAREKDNLQDIVSKVDRHRFASEEMTPSLLPIELKRYDNAGGKSKKNIVPTPVLDVPIEQGNKESERYRLAAVVVHQGEGVRSGHYFTYAPKILNQKEVWVEYNDSTVAIHERPHTSPPQMALENGYLFLYEKV